MLQMGAGYQWYLQVIYTIGPAGRMTHRRYQRSALDRVPGMSQEDRNGTNIHTIHLDSSAFDSQRASKGGGAAAAIIAPVVCVLIVLVLLVICGVIMYRRWQQGRKGVSTFQQPNNDEDCSRERQPINTARCSNHEHEYSSDPRMHCGERTPIRVNRTVHAHRNRWSLRPKSGTEV